MNEERIINWIGFGICMSLAFIDVFLQTNLAVFGIIGFVFGNLYSEMNKK